jgi:nucleoside-diphosphate-sugar epimerase
MLIIVPHSTQRSTGAKSTRSFDRTILSARAQRLDRIGPRACYDEGKRVAEALTYGYARQDGVDVRVARIFNT